MVTLSASGGFVLAREVVAAADDAAAGDGDERHRLRLARLEADGGPGRDVEPFAVRGVAIEGERAIGFDEVIVAPDLDRTIAGVRHLEADARAPLVCRNLAVAREDFARGPRQRDRARNRRGGRRDRKKAAVER